MNLDQIKELLKNPETQVEGLLSLDELIQEYEGKIKDLQQSNERYKETNANLAMKISAPSQDVEIEDSEEERAKKILDEWAKSMY